MRRDEQAQPFGPSNPRRFVEGDWGQSLDSPKQNDAVGKQSVAVDWSRCTLSPGGRKTDVTVLCAGLRFRLSDSIVRLGCDLVNSHCDSQPADVPAGRADGRHGGESRAAVVEHLFRGHNEALLRFLTARLNSVQEADEVAQEAYIRLLQLGTQRAQAVTFLRAFLYKTAENLAIDRLRTRQVAARALKIGFFEQPSHAEAPDNAAAAAEELHIIEQCLRELPPKCRQAFFLIRFHGLSCSDVAHHMHIAERTVRSYILETIRHCRRRLDRLTEPKRFLRSKIRGA